MVTRRESLLAGALGAGAVALRVRDAVAAQLPADGRRSWEARYSGPDDKSVAASPGLPGKDYQPVVTPNGAALPFKIVDGVKVFHLVAEEVDHVFMAGLRAKCWGYNGRVHGPTIEAVEGDRLRIYVTNRLPAPTSVHWHGLFVPSGMDGVAGLTQRAIAPGETFKYELTARQHGTFMYHSHHDEMVQMALGLMGLIVLHPRRPSPDYRVDRDFALLLSEWRIDAGASRPNPNEMLEFNVLTFNARSYPGTDALVVKKGDRVRIRLGNLSTMDHHPIHMHGHFFKVTATDGGTIPLSAQWPEATVLVPVGSTRDIEFIADAEGDWPLHCHMTHHAMNQMGHGAPNMVGVKPGPSDSGTQKLVPGYMTMGQDGMGDMADMSMPVPPNSVPMMGAKGPFGPITMGGMFTLIKVRDRLASYDSDPGWYAHPKGTVADVASAADLARDGIQPPKP